MAAARAARAAREAAALGSLYSCPNPLPQIGPCSTTESRVQSWNPGPCTPNTSCSRTKRGRRTASPPPPSRWSCTAAAELRTGDVPPPARRTLPMQLPAKPPLCRRLLRSRRLGTTMAIARTWPRAWPPSTGGKTTEPLSPLDAAVYGGHLARRARACAQTRLHACMCPGWFEAACVASGWRYCGERLQRVARASMHARACEGVQRLGSQAASGWRGGGDATAHTREARTTAVQDTELA